MVTKDNFKRKEVNWVVAQKWLDEDARMSFIVRVNGAALTGMQQLESANCVAYGAAMVLRALGYDTRIKFADE